MRREKKFVVLAVALVLLLVPQVLAVQTSLSADSFYAQDNSGVLSRETKQFITDCSAALEQQAEGAQIAVLTVPTTEGKDLDSYALEKARELALGAAGKDNGLLILLVTEDRKVKVEVGYGLEGAINDAKAGRLIDERALDSYKKNDFDTGTLELYKGVLSEVMKEYDIDQLAGYQREDDNDWMGILAPIGIVLLIVLLSFGSRHGPGGRRNRILFMPFFGGNHHRGGFGGGGFGGGFGGGGFSGGGGSFGGGGAGRSF